MTGAAGVLRALDGALDAVTRAERRGMRTRHDLVATAELEGLRKVLVAQRERVRNGDAVEPDRMAALIREVAAWTEDSEVKLLAVLGAVVEAAQSAGSG